ncbi:angiogenic factor with G patch and FHA domains 1 [Callorhinchus milii]|uniref:Angiogenic factor with G patch and FHA domains 1 n=1 Tax=Callorhinchus milii TaxID=7868 RepID=A0A4W3GG98_CALMI|nr:angiogenic factor with G patch and FHA domains 1 [Callorhinchus milii]XP_007903574.1 angiogenic factor with G patch and FHA domains 1 [Callorhinchus milii]XP_042190691.1 angiogenic factor with G patch and FHA domains 1 [Callorhinchus milii]|eukprot:gi/632974257/ref/XP_007903573.1/ PREDICTED: angiogenic factor with G patch and FHA domains 1 [Callorhinchus milii]
MALADGNLDLVPDCELHDLQQKVKNLEEELANHKTQIHKLQKQLNQTEQLYKNSENYNEDLRKQVEDLSKEMLERKMKEMNRIDTEVQTDLCIADHHTGYYHNETQDSHQALNSDQYDNGNMVEPEIRGDLEEIQDETQASAQLQAQVQVDDYQYTEYTSGSLSLLDVYGDHNSIDQNAEESENTSLADSLRATAEAAMSQTGFTYDDNTGMYYDYTTGFYYDSASQLYYDAHSGIYYYYDAESGRYQFHSRVDLQAYQCTAEQNPEKKVKKKRRGVEKIVTQEEKDTEAEVKKASSNGTSQDQGEENVVLSEESIKRRKRVKVEDVNLDWAKSEFSPSADTNIQDGTDEDSEAWEEDSEPEEGEITDSDKCGDSVDEEMDKEFSEEDEESEKEEGQPWPPCIRVTVVRSPVLTPGTLFIITAVTSATIGRDKDMDHTIRLPEMAVSKFHAEVYFDQELQQYVLVDQCSQNGTVLNGTRILTRKNKCDPHALEHGDEVKIGETVLSFHIHPGTDTCNGCEPGQVIAHLRLNKKESAAVPVLSKEEKDKLRRRELKQIRVKYGLQNSAYEECEALKNPAYKDRAGRRRHVVGSDCIYQKDDAPASVNVEIGGTNKGRKMLEKMGWKKGEGLGKGSCGIKEPIQVHLHQSHTGLGAAVPLGIEDVQMVKSKNEKNWAKARERFSETFQQTTNQKEGKIKTPWMKGEGIKEHPEDFPTT